MEEEALLGQLGLGYWMGLEPPESAFAELLVDVSASRLAFVFAFRGFGGWLLAPGHKQGTEHLCIDGSG